MHARYPSSNVVAVVAVVAYPGAPRPSRLVSSSSCFLVSLEQPDIIVPFLWHI